MTGGFIAAFLVIFFLVRLAWRRIYRFRNRTEDDVTPFMLRVDLAELSYLVDNLTEEQLRYELSPGEFRKEQLVRLRLLQEYTRRMRHNADILQEWGEYGFNRRRYAEEDGIRSHSLELIKNCREFRYGARSIAKLAAGLDQSQAVGADAVFLGVAAAVEAVLAPPL